jgi:hypothetical protein
MANVPRGTIVDNAQTVDIRFLFASSAKRLYTPQSLEWESGEQASQDFGVDERGSALTCEVLINPQERLAVGERTYGG